MPEVGKHLLNGRDIIFIFILIILITITLVIHRNSSFGFFTNPSFNWALMADPQASLRQALCLSISPSPLF